MKAQMNLGDPVRIVVGGAAKRALLARRRVAARKGAEDASTVAKVSHTLPSALADRVRTVAFAQGVSESAVIERALEALFAQYRDERNLGEYLRGMGAGLRRRKI